MDGTSWAVKKAPVWHPVPSTTSTLGGAARAKATTPGWNGSASPEATRAGIPDRARAWVTASQAAKSAAEA